MQYVITLHCSLVSSSDDLYFTDDLQPLTRQKNLTLCNDYELRLCNP